MSFGGTRRDDANVLASPRVHDDEQSAHRSHAKRDESLLFRIGFFIRDRDGVGSSKTGIASGIRTPCLRKLIPALLASSHSKPTASSVRTDCAYVNSSLRGDAGACGALRQRTDSASKTGIASKLCPNRKRLSLFKSARAVRNRRAPPAPAPRDDGCQWRRGRWPMRPPESAGVRRASAVQCRRLPNARPARQ